jgi:hypothetical protein
MAGYEVWRFNDAQQATAPIFLKFEFGSNVPTVKITVGTGSNGSGTITGTALSIARNFNGSSPQTTNTARQSYMCHTDGFFGVNWKVGSSQSVGAFAIARTVNAAGVADATGAIVLWGSGVTSPKTATQAFRYAAPAVAYPAATTTVAIQALGINPQASVSTAVGSDIQVALGFTITPRVQPIVGLVGVLKGELAPGGTFTFTPVGTTPRTYLTWSDEGGAFGPIDPAAVGGMNTAMLWE